MKNYEENWKGFGQYLSDRALEYSNRDILRVLNDIKRDMMNLTQAEIELIKKHRQEQEPKNNPKARERFLSTYSGKELLRKHALTDVGIWTIEGEDPNCDFGGPHIQPKLATVRGKLDDVIDYAVVLKGFWGWGAGGDIRSIEVIDVPAK